MCLLGIRKSNEHCSKVVSGCWRSIREKPELRTHTRTITWCLWLYEPLGTKTNGLLVAIDFQKAFDSVNHCFMVEALSAFNFGPSLIHWVQIFYKSISSTVINNGYATTPFQVLRGVRQGENIKGIIVDKEEIKLEFFADDLTSFLRDRTSLNALFETINCFTSFSGLKVNYKKTEVMLLGNHNPNPPTPVTCSDRNITVKKANFRYSLYL